MGTGIGEAHWTAIHQSLIRIMFFYDYYLKFLHRSKLIIEWSRILIDIHYFKIAITLFSLSTSIFSQGVFLQKGGSGLSGEAGYHYGVDYHDLIGKLNYSIRGVFDFGVNVENEIFKDYVLNYDLNTSSINPFISITEHSDPVILSVNFSYQHDFINSDAFNILNIQASGDYYSAGGLIAKRTYGSESFFIQAAISANYVAGRKKAISTLPINPPSPAKVESQFSRVSVKKDSIFQKIPAGQTLSDFTRKLVLGAGISFCFETSNGTILHITPKVQVDKENKSVGINAGFVLRTARSHGLRREQKDIVMQLQGAIYMDIENALKEHFLVYVSDNTPMKEGDSFTIVREDKQSPGGLRWIEIGVGKVVKIQGHKAVLESKLYDTNDQVTTGDKIIFSY